MTSENFKQALTNRRQVLGLTYKDIVHSTGLGYNTVRRVFNDPMSRPLGTVKLVMKTMGCFIDVTIEDNVGDDLE